MYCSKISIYIYVCVLPFPVNVGLRQGCVMSPRLFNVYMEGVVREVNVRVLGKGLELLSANDGRFEINQLLNGEPLAKVDCFKYIWSQVAANGGCEKDMVHRMNEGYRAWGALKSVLSNKGLGIKAKKCLYEGVIVQTALYGAEAWGMRSAERRKVNVLEMNYLQSLVGVSRMDRVRNEEVRMKVSE